MFHLDAAIDKAESLATATRQEKQQEQPEISVDTEKEEVVGLGMVAEQQYEYGADAFEAYQQSIKGTQVAADEKQAPQVKNKSR